MLHRKLYSAFAVEIEVSKIRKQVYQRSISVRRFNAQDKYQDASEDVFVADKPECQVDIVFSNPHQLYSYLHTLHSVVRH